MFHSQTYLFPAVLCVTQIIFTILFGFHSKYRYFPNSDVNIIEQSSRGLIDFCYPMFTDIHVMMFVSFGFILTYLRRYFVTNIGFLFILCAFTIEWSLIIRGYLFDWNSTTRTFIIDVQSLIMADFVAITTLTSMGTILGKVNGVQLIIMAFCEVPIQIINRFVGVRFFCANDPGESMYVHTFGAFFGLAITFVLYRSRPHCPTLEKSNGISDQFAMIGTVFFFCFWPSLNAGTAVGIDRLHAVINTYVSICASVIGALLTSIVVKSGKFDITDVQNSTLSGGVAIGTIATCEIGLHGAMIIGTLAGIVSVLGFHFLLPNLKKFRLDDNCGVNIVHGIPGLLAGITGIVVVLMSNRSGYLNHLTDACLSGGKLRTNNIQSVYQAAALGLTIGMASVGGLITGVILKLPVFHQIIDNFQDDLNRHLPNELLQRNYQIRHTRF